MIENPTMIEGAPIAVSEASRQMIRRATSLAGYDSSILISGETGSGKTTLAHYIHSISPRQASPLISLHGIEITVPMLEEGLVRAQGGTLLIEYLSECPPEIQGRLVRLLQQPMAERKTRIIATAPDDVRTAVQYGTLRQDLYFLITELTVSVAPLRERVEDILPLAARFLASFNRQSGPCMLSASSIELLRRHRWDGNIRELLNTLRRAALLCPTSLIEPEFIELDAISCVSPSFDSKLLNGGDYLAARDPITIDGRGAFARQRDQAERAILLAALRDGRSSRTDVAQRLGISPRTLRYKLARLRAAGMEVPA